MRVKYTRPAFQLGTFLLNRTLRHALRHSCAQLRMISRADLRVLRRSVGVLHRAVRHAVRQLPGLEARNIQKTFTCNEE